MKLILSFLSVIFFALNSIGQNSNVEGLTIKFIKLSEDYVYPGAGYERFNATSPSAIDGMKFVNIRVKMKNEGNKDCIFNLDEVYVSTELDSLYRFYKYFKNANNKVKIKPQKENIQVVVVEFPSEMKPKELFIEDKRYKIVVEEK